MATQSSMNAMFGFNLQSGKGTAATVFKYIPALTFNMMADQRVAAIPPEVGGTMWQRGSYKQSVVAAGDVSFNARPDYLGYLLYALTGNWVSATGTLAGEDNSLTGGYHHRFYPSTSLSATQWLTTRSLLDQDPDRRFADCLIRTFRIEMPTTGLVTMTAGFIGITPLEVTGSQAATGVESKLPFVSMVGSANLDNIAGTTVPATRIALDFANQLTEDEFVISSYYLDNISLLGRSLNVTFDTFVRDATLWRKVYRNNAASLGTGAWDPTVYTGSLDVTVKIATGTSALRVRIPKMDFLSFPISLSGNQVVRSTLTGQVSLVSTFNDDEAAIPTASDKLTDANFKKPYVIDLVNDQNIVYSSPAV